MGVVQLALGVRVSILKPLVCFFSAGSRNEYWNPKLKYSSTNCSVKLRVSSSATQDQIATSEQPKMSKVIDSHLHVWASPEEVTSHKVQNPFMLFVKHILV